MYFPDYNNCILNVMASIARGLNGKTNYSPSSLLNPQEIKKAKNVVLIVLDGLGYEYLMKYGKDLKLKKHLRGKITSIFPAATTACVPAFLTGMSAYEHGMSGWYSYLKELGMVITPLPYITRTGGLSLDKVEFRKLFDVNPFSKKVSVKSYILNPAEFYDSAFNRATKGKSKLLGYKNIKDMFYNINRLLVKGGKKYIYAYHSNPDSLMHEFGVEDKGVLREVKKIDKEFANFIRRIRSTKSIIIITADHGLITVPKNRQIDTLKYAELNKFLRIPLCGEGRMGYAYVKAGREKEFEEYVKNKLGFCCELMKSEEAVNKGWFGKGKMHPCFKDRIGDYLLIMKENYGIKDFVADSDPEDQNIGRHGGVSKEEMFVPLFVVRTGEGEKEIKSR